jgi:hypothetical protein
MHGFLGGWTQKAGKGLSEEVDASPGELEQHAYKEQIPPCWSE